VGDFHSMISADDLHNAITYTYDIFVIPINDRLIWVGHAAFKRFRTLDAMMASNAPSSNPWDMGSSLMSRVTNSICDEIWETYNSSIRVGK
jgi:hypothetical protein